MEGEKNMAQFGVLPYILIGAVLLVVLFVFRGLLKKMLRFLLRMAASLGILTVLSGLGSSIGVTLGANLFNAFVMALLGVPGFGLLLMLRWAFLV